VKILAVTSLLLLFAQILSPIAMNDSFLSDKTSAAGRYYHKLIEEHRVKLKVKSVSSGLDEFTKPLPPATAPTTSPDRSLDDIVSHAMGSSSTTGASMISDSSSGRKLKRNRWGPVAIETSITPAKETSPPLPPSPKDKKEPEVITKYLPKVMDEDAERQLREQKKMQELEQRIREAARAQLQLSGKW